MTKGPLPFTFFIPMREMALGERYPKGFGAVGMDYLTHRVIVAPIPFNFVFAYLRSFWHWLKGGFNPPWLERKFEEIYQKAFQEAQKNYPYSHYDLHKAYRKGLDHQQAYFQVQDEVFLREERKRWEKR